MSDMITTSSVSWAYGTLIWRIQNFSEVCGLHSGANENENGNITDVFERASSKEFKSLLDIDFLQSPMIHVESDAQQTGWYIRLVKSPQVSNEIDVYIDCDDIRPDIEGAPEDECFFKYSIEIKGSATTEYILTKASSKIILIKKEKSYCVPGFLKVDFLRTRMADLLEDDTLTLTIELAILRDVHHSNNDGPSSYSYERSWFPTINRKPGDINLNSSERKWSENVNLYGGHLASCILSSLWANRNYNGDVTIQCAGSTFTAHKTILSGASPVFLAAFTHDMTEKASGQLKIDDISPEVLEAVLDFIYGDYNLHLMQHKWKNVNFLAEVLNAAEKYQIMQLKMLCFSKLCDELSLNNAAKIIVLAHLYEPEDSVKKFIHEFAINNIGVLQGMTSFKEKMNEMPAAFTPLLLLAKSSN